MIKALLLAAEVICLAGSSAASPPRPDPAGRIDRAHAASARLVREIAAIPGVYGVSSARTHDGVELIFAWFEDRQAVLRWFRSDYHRQILREARRSEDGIAADHFGDDVGPILVVATASYRGQPQAADASMFDDPDAGRPTSFSIEYYRPLAGGAFFTKPFSPPAFAAQIEGLRNLDPVMPKAKPPAAPK